MAPIVAAAWCVEAAAQAPLPDVDRVDHAHPEAAMELLPSMGSRERIEAIARDPR